MIIRRTAAFAAALIISVFAICSCGETGIPADVSGTAPDETETETEAETELAPDLPERDFGGKAINFLVRSEIFHWYWSSKEIYSEKQNGEVINDAVFTRNIAVEDAYNCRITEYRSDNPINDANKAINSGDDVYDVFMTNMIDNAGLAQKGSLVNLKSMEYIDFEKPWWDDRAVASLSLGGKLYWTLGDINIMDNDATWSNIFNKKLIADYNLEDPYSIVRAGEWTISKMYEQALAVVTDIDGDGSIGINDRVGHLSEVSNTYGMFIGAGEAIAKKDETDLPHLSLNSERASDVITAVLDFMLDADTTLLADNYIGKYNNPWDELTRPMFMDNRGLFYTIGLGTVTLLRDMDSDFGILPIPKYDADQREYYHYVHPWSASTVSVPVVNSDTAFTGFILEAMAARSMYTLTPAYYEITITNKVMRDTDSEEMLDIILGSLAYDFGAVFNWGGTSDIFPQLTNQKSYDYVSACASREKAAKTAMDKTVAAFAENG
jgi:hypothetical protein